MGGGRGLVVGERTAADGLELDQQPLDLALPRGEGGPHPALDRELRRERGDELGFAGVGARPDLGEAALDPLRRAVGERLLDQPGALGGVLERGDDRARVRGEGRTVRVVG